MARKPTPDQTRDASDRLDDEGGRIAPKLSAAGMQKVELERLGIIARPTTIYEWGGFRYTNASDAIFAAKRSS